MPLYDRVKFTTATTGTGTVTVGAAAAGYQTPAQAKIPTGTSGLPYVIEEGTAWEIGTGTYNATGTTFTRTFESSSTGSLLTLGGAATMYIAATAKSLTLSGMTTVEVDLGSAAVTSGSFTITGSGLVSGSAVTVLQAPGPYSGKGLRGDEAQMHDIVVSASITDAVTIQCQWSSSYRVRGKVKFQVTVGSGTVAPPVDASVLYAPDITVVGSTGVAAYDFDSGWETRNSTGTTAASGKLYIQNGQFNSYGDTYTQPGQLLIGKDVGSAAQYGMSLKMRIVSLSEMCFAVASTNTANCLFFKINSTAFTVTKRVAGADTGLGSIGGWTWTDGTEIEVRVFNQTMEVYIGAYLRGTFDLSTGGAFTPGTFWGWGDFVSGTRFDRFSVNTISGQLTLSAPPRFAPSDVINSGTKASDYVGRDVAVSGTYATSAGLTVPTGLQARLLNLATGATVRDWADMGNVQFFAGKWTGTISSPVGGDYLPQVRMKNDTSVLANSTANAVFAVGGVTAYYGQSNAGNTLNVGSADSAIDAYANSKTFVWVRDLLNPVGLGVWNTNNPTLNNTRAHAHARAMADAFGLPWAVVGGGVAARTAVSLSPIVGTGSYDPYFNDGPLHFDQLLRNIDLAGATGRISGLVYDQGEAESDTSGSAVDTTAYKASLTTIFDAFNAKANKGRKVPVLITITGRCTDAPTANQNDNWSAIRRAQKELSAVYPNALISQNNNSITLGDSIHYGTGATGGVLKAYRSGKTLSNKLLGTSYSGQGPKMATGSRSGATITIPVSLNGAASLGVQDGTTATTGASSSSALTGWRVSTDGFSTTKTISSVVLSGSNVVITLAADPGAACVVDNHYGRNPAITSIVIGNYADGTTIPAEPIVVPLNVG